MKPTDIIQVILFIICLIALTPIIGSYTAKVFEGQRIPGLAWLEKLSYKIGKIDSQEEMSWKTYAKNLLIFNFIGIVAVFALQLLQSALPLNPQGMGPVTWHSAINTAVSFVTNTNWQGYSGEVTLSYLTQMVALVTQNFLSAAVGIAVAVALIRGLVRRSSSTIGNFLGRSD